MKALVFALHMGKHQQMPLHNRLYTRLHAQQ